MNKNKKLDDDEVTHTITVTVVKVKLTVPAKTQEGLDSDKFTVEALPATLTPSKYEWRWRAPDGAGNTPQVNFATGSEKSTIAKRARWFALPDSRLAKNTLQNCAYKITCAVTVNGMEIVPLEDYWVVEFPSDAGVTTPPLLSGGPAVSSKTDNNGKKIWYVKDKGTMARSAPVVKLNIPLTSQFYNKVKVHEDRHVEQWTKISPWKDLYSVDVMYNALKNLTSTVSRADLESKIITAWKAKNDKDIAETKKDVNVREKDAWDVSNKVEPHYQERDIP